MGTFRVLETSYINDRVVEEGDIVEIEVETPGMIAPAATATKPAINAYSIRS